MLMSSRWWSWCWRRWSRRWVANNVRDFSECTRVSWNLESFIQLKVIDADNCFDLSTGSSTKTVSDSTTSAAHDFLCFYVPLTRLILACCQYCTLVNRANSKPKTKLQHPTNHGSYDTSNFNCFFLNVQGWTHVLDAASVGEKSIMPEEMRLKVDDGSLTEKFTVSSNTDEK